MVVGYGDLASVLPESDLLFFASGVSNSQETRESEYQREVDLLLEQPRDAHIVYFGSLAVFYSDTRYTTHKRYMEALVEQEFPTHTIFRIGNIEFGSNPNTIVNFFRRQIRDGVEPEVQDVYRYLVSQHEFLHWINLIPYWSCEMNVPGRMIKVQRIVDEIKEGKL